MCKEHQKLQYHQASLELADELRCSIEQPERALTALIDGEKAQNIDRNRQLLKSLVKTVLFCGRQCIALRGRMENLDAPGNPGNCQSTTAYCEAIWIRLHCVMQPT